MARIHDVNVRVETKDGFGDDSRVGQGNATMFNRLWCGVSGKHEYEYFLRAKKILIN